MKAIVWLNNRFVEQWIFRQVALYVKNVLMQNCCICIRVLGNSQKLGDNILISLDYF